MTNPYTEAAFEVFYEALDEVSRVEEAIVGTYGPDTDRLFAYQVERETITHLMGNLRMKLKALDDNNDYEAIGDEKESSND